jgi:tetratricopeptide (TPR) repeat protein
MSYINDALRRAQRERDCRYERFGEIIASRLDGAALPGKRRFLLGAAVTLVVLVPAVLLLAVYALNQSPPAGRGNQGPAPVPGEKAAVTGAVVPPTGRSAAATAVPQTEKAFARAEDRAPASGEARALYLEALAAQRKGELDGAEALYRKVLLLAPGHVQALNNLGVLYMGQKKSDRAISMFSRAIVLKKDYVDPYYNMACLYAQAKEIDESIWYLKIAVAINGDVKKWVEKDADMKNVAESPAFKKITEGQKN